MSKQILKFPWTLKSTDEMKLMMKFFLCFHIFSLLWNLFSRVPKRNCFRQIFISLTSKKCKKNSNILKIMMVQGFCPLKTEIARFPVGFRLNTSVFSVLVQSTDLFKPAFLPPTINITRGLLTKRHMLIRTFYSHQTTGTNSKQSFQICMPMENAGRNKIFFNFVILFNHN